MAILTLKNKVVYQVNNIILQKISGEVKIYNSSDSVRSVRNDDDEDLSATFPVEYLNSLQVPGIPPHDYF